jgi:hypothetical protein
VNWGATAQNPPSAGGITAPSIDPSTADPSIASALQDQQNILNATMQKCQDAGLAPGKCSDYVTALGNYKTNVAQLGASEYQQDAQKDKDKEDDGTPRRQAKTRAGDDECHVGGQINTNYGCGGTRTFIKSNQITNAVGQAGGALMTQVQGAQAQTSALQAGTQSSAISAAATVQKGSAESQLALGTVSLMMGMMELERSARHKKYAKELRDGLKTESSVQAGELYGAKKDGADWQGDRDNRANWTRTDDAHHVVEGALNSDDVDSARKAADDNIAHAATVLQDAKDEETKYLGLMKTNPTLYKTAYDSAHQAAVKAQKAYTGAVASGSSSVTDAGQKVGRTAYNEQTAVATAASDAGLQGMAAGGTQFMQGVLNMAAANQLEDAAKQMAASEAAAGLTLQPPAQDPFPVAPNRTPTVITGNGAAPGNGSAASDQQNPADNGVPPLGAGLPQPTDGNPNGPPVTPGKFVPGQGTAAAGGGAAGAGGLTGGSTTPPGPDGAEKGPMAANPFVGGAMYGGGAGTVGPANQGAKEERLNPADMMAAALGILKPKGGNEESGAQAYGRAPAGGGPGILNGLALPEEDLFKIIEGGYRRQIQAGNIGG